MISLENEEDPSRSLALNSLPTYSLEQNLVFYGINALCPQWQEVVPKKTTEWQFVNSMANDFSSR